MLTERGEEKLIKTNKKDEEYRKNKGFSWISCLYFKRKEGEKLRDVGR